MASSFEFTKVIDSPTSDKLVYNLHFHWDGEGSITTASDTGGVKVGNATQTTAFPANFFTVASNLLIDVSALENSPQYPAVSSVRLTKAKGQSSNWQKGITSFFLVDSQGNRYYTFPYDSFKNDFYPQGYHFSDAKTNANGDLYFGAILEPGAGGHDTHSQTLDVEICLRKNYGG